MKLKLLHISFLLTRFSSSHLHFFLLLVSFLHFPCVSFAHFSRARPQQCLAMLYVSFAEIFFASFPLLSLTQMNWICCSHSTFSLHANFLSLPPDRFVFTIIAFHFHGGLSCCCFAFFFIQILSAFECYVFLTNNSPPAVSQLSAPPKPEALRQVKKNLRKTLNVVLW